MSRSRKDGRRGGGHRNTQGREYWSARAEADDVLVTLGRVLHEVQRHQPGGSPPPGGPVELATWVLTSLRAEADALRVAGRRVLDEIAFGCGTEDDSATLPIVGAGPTGAAGRALLALWDLCRDRTGAGEGGDAE